MRSWKSYTKGPIGCVHMLVLALVLMLVTALSVNAAIRKYHRSAAQRAAFMRAHPCPANGHTKGKCPGYIVDHIIPLKCGGPDRPSNMQWQTTAEGRAKDKWERIGCK